MISGSEAFRRAVTNASSAARLPTLFGKAGQNVEANSKRAIGALVVPSRGDATSFSVGVLSRLVPSPSPSDGACD